MLPIFFNCDVREKNAQNFTFSTRTLQLKKIEGITWLILANRYLQFKTKITILALELTENFWAAFL